MVGKGEVERVATARHRHPHRDELPGQELTAAFGGRATRRHRRLILREGV